MVHRYGYELLRYHHNIITFTGAILFPASLVLAFYGPVAYAIVNDAEQEKIDKEQAMQQEWFKLRKANVTEDLEPPEFVYESTLNKVSRNFYFLTVPCQGLAYMLAVAHHYVDYKKWNTLGKLIANLCLPVDVLIFYIEPLGFAGTLIAMVLGFIPFAITIADAMFPEKIVRVKGLKEKIIIIQKNSWRKHISGKYNERILHVVKRTIYGYNMFASLALSITLFKGDTKIISTSVVNLT